MLLRVQVLPAVPCISATAAASPRCAPTSAAVPLKPTPAPMAAGGSTSCASGQAPWPHTLKLDSKRSAAVRTPSSAHSPSRPPPLPACSSPVASPRARGSPNSGTPCQPRPLIVASTRPPPSLAWSFLPPAAPTSRSGACSSTARPGARSACAALLVPQSCAVLACVSAGQDPVGGAGGSARSTRSSTRSSMAVCPGPMRLTSAAARSMRRRCVHGGCGGVARQGSSGVGCTGAGPLRCGEEGAGAG